MAALPQVKNDIFAEETSYRASVSENTMQKIGSSLNWINHNAGDIIGEIKASCLTLAQFQALKNNTWVLMDGSSIAGSDLAVLTGITTLPNMVSNEAFLGQKNAQAMFAYEASQNKAHVHSAIYIDYGSSGVDSDASGSYGLFTTTGSEGGTVSRPNTYRVNFFIKINNNPT